MPIKIRQEKSSTPATTPSGRLRFILQILLCLSALLILCTHAQTSPEKTTQAEENIPADTTNNPIDAQTAPDTPPPPTISIKERDSKLLADALEDESNWLDTAYGKILTLYKPTESSDTKGALLLLHASEAPQFWPPELENLRTKLPKFGWETLAVSLPQKSQIPPPPRAAANQETQVDTAIDEAASSAEDESASSTETNNETGADAIESERENTPKTSDDEIKIVPREELIKANLLAAIKFLNQKGQYNLVVLVDNSSLYWSMQLLSPEIKTNRLDAKTVDGPLQALIVFNLQANEPLTKEELEASFNQPQLPILDIFLAPNSLNNNSTADLHRAVALRHKIQQYQQLTAQPLPSSMIPSADTYLLGRIRGFMNREAKGAEIKKP